MDEVKYPELEGLSPDALAGEMLKLKNEIEELGKQKSECQNKFDHLRRHLLPKAMEDNGLESFRSEAAGGKGVNIHTEVFVHVPAEKREELQSWLKDHGHGALVTETVNASTLKSFVSNLIREGKEHPGYIKVSMVPTARFYA